MNKKKNNKTNKLIDEFKTLSNESQRGESDQVNKAIKYLQNKNYEEAEKIYRKLILGNTKNHIVYGNLAAICWMTNKKQESHDLLLKAININSQYYEGLNNLGTIIKKQGNLELAIKYFKKALNIFPEYPQALNNLANSLQDKNEIKSAIAIYRKALTIKPNDEELHHNLAIALQKDNQLIEAISSLKKSIEINPEYPDAFNSLGSIYQKNKNYSIAINYFEKAIDLNPKLLSATYNLGVTYHMSKNLSLAIKYYKFTLELNPNFILALNNIGIAYQEQGDYMQGIDFFEKAININPMFPEPIYNIAFGYEKIGKIEKAIYYYEKVLSIKKDYLNAIINLGNIWKKKDDIFKAIQVYKQALEFDKNNADILNNLGICFQDLNNHDDAIEYYNQALKINPKHQDAMNNIGVCLKILGDIDQSILYFKNAISINPKDAETHNNLAHTLLLKGDYETGWKEYEYRLEKNNPKLACHAKPKIIKKNNNLIQENEKLLVVSEQGLGDTLQFMRYVPHLADLGINVNFCAQEKLHELIKISRIHSSPISPQDVDIITDGSWIPLMSIPRLLKVSPSNPICNQIYLRTSKELSNKWKHKFKSEKRFKIGLNWQGNKNIEKSVYQGRSLALEKFRPLAYLKDIKFISLQKGFGSEQLENCSFINKFIDCQKEINQIWDLVETAAMISNCDLVITTDTSVAHLAGGMGKATWLMLKDIPEWRWGMKSQKTFWYPSIRLFRQTERGNWDLVMNQIKQELKHIL